MRINEEWTMRTSAGVLSKGVACDMNCIEYLVKGTSEEGSKEPLSEYFASEILALFTDTLTYGLRHKKYCPEIVTFNYPYLSESMLMYGDRYQFYEVIKNTERVKNESFEEFVVRKINEYNLDKEHLLRVLILDAFIGNCDRHWNNLDVVLTEDGGIKWGKLLDFGASLLFNISDRDLVEYDEYDRGPDSSKPFAGNHKENIAKAKKLLGVNDKVIKRVELEDVLKVLEDRYSRLPEDACSEKRFNSIKSYLTARYPVYIEPYIE